MSESGSDELVVWFGPNGDGTVPDASAFEAQLVELMAALQEPSPEELFAPFLATPWDEEIWTFAEDEGVGQEIPQDEAPTDTIMEDRGPYVPPSPEIDHAPICFIPVDLDLEGQQENREGDYDVNVGQRGATGREE